ncbi:hypothetical protein ACIBJF_48435 [Streptomyces sp. NPDC050743]|uniref:hypothetical protein n=1 Tax=Streptomyces sp. NPDC050743 TaxID=3365634 RepID=UPI003792008E
MAALSSVKRAGFGRRGAQRAVAVLGVLVVACAATGAADASDAVKRPHPRRAPWMVTVTVQTVPVLAHVRFTFDGAQIVTDSRGRATYTGSHDFEEHSLTLHDAVINTKHRRYRFARWSGQRDPDQAFRTSVEGLPLRADYTVTAAFSARYPVTTSFTDQHGTPVAAGRISSVSVRSDTGSRVDVPPGRTVWLDGLLPVFRKSVLTTRTISYSLQSVMVDGTNTVDAGKQRFTPAGSDQAVFVTQFHDLTISAHDAVLAGAIGSAAKVTMPDGKVRTIPFGRDASATLRGLPRGHYAVDVKAGGLTARQEVLLSKDRAVDVQVIGDEDLVGAAGLLLAIAVGLLFAGRTAARRAAGGTKPGGKTAGKASKRVWKKPWNTSGRKAVETTDDTAQEQLVAKTDQKSRRLLPRWAAVVEADGSPLAQAGEATRAGTPGKAGTEPAPSAKEDALHHARLPEAGDMAEEPPGESSDDPSPNVSSEKAGTSSGDSDSDNAGEPSGEKAVVT